jgi:hypothetical protein
MVPGGQFISGCLWAVDGLMGIGYGVIAYYAAPGQGIIIFGWTYSYPYSVWLGSQ